MEYTDIQELTNNEQDEIKQSWALGEEYIKRMVLEEKIKELYKKYKEISKEYARLSRLKQELAQQFADDVVSWSHSKFRHPSNARLSVRMYTAARHLHLKDFAPNYTMYRGLIRNLREKDDWIHTRIEDDPFCSWEDL
jgi:hypothetical protein